jgi:hypothetical protein
VPRRRSTELVAPGDFSRDSLLALPLPGQKVPDVVDLLGLVVGILQVTGDAFIEGDLLEPQSPARRVDEIVDLAIGNRQS